MGSELAPFFVRTGNLFVVLLIFRWETVPHDRQLLHHVRDLSDRVGLGSHSDAFNREFAFLTFRLSPAVLRTSSILSMMK